MISPLFHLVFNDERLLVIDKQPGVDFHRGLHDTSLVDAVRDATGLAELYPVHRLDTMTSGLLLFAKSREVARQMGQLFESGQVGKYYLALSAKAPRKKQGMIRGDMEQARRGAWRLSPSQTNPAVTQFFSFSVSAGLRLFLLRPLTGKTHQLRVAMKALGAPILGDALYGGGSLDRGYLHAYAIRFLLDGQQYCLTCQPKTGEHFLAMSCRQQIELIGDPGTLAWPAVKNPKQS